MTDAVLSSEHESQSVAVRERLVQRFDTDRAAALYGYWQLLTTPTGSGRLRESLGPEGYRKVLAALAQAGVDLPRQPTAGPATGLEAASGPGASARLTVERQLIRQARLDGLFGWGPVTGGLDVTYVRAGAVGYPRDALVIGLAAQRLLPMTYHAADVRGTPSLVAASPPLLARVGGYSDASGGLRVFASQPLPPDDAIVTALFGDGRALVEVVVYRCYDGPGAEDASFAVARGVLW